MSREEPRIPFRVRTRLAEDLQPPCLVAAVDNCAFWENERCPRKLDPDTEVRVLQPDERLIETADRGEEFPPDP
jgi:hypothetical protein